MKYGIKEECVACFPQDKVISGWAEISEEDYQEYMLGNMKIQDGTLVKIDEKVLLDRCIDNKHTELKSVMTSKRQALTVAYDSDTFDANEDAQANMIVLLKSFDLGATSVSIRSTTEQTHTFNKEHTQELSMLMLQAVNNLYSKYWEYKDALYNCKTIEEVETISWKE